MNIHELTVAQRSAAARLSLSGTFMNVFCLCDFSQAGLDKMAQGHMLADVVAIIGEFVWALTLPPPQLHNLLMLT